MASCPFGGLNSLLLSYVLFLVIINIIVVQGVFVTGSKFWFRCLVEGEEGPVSWGVKDTEISLQPGVVARLNQVGWST